MIKFYASCFVFRSINRSSRSMSLFSSSLKPTSCNDSGFAYLEFLESKASTSTSTAVVLDGRALDNRSETVDWTRRNRSSLYETSGSTSGLATWLIEVNSDSSLPILVEVRIGDDVVVFDRLYFQRGNFC